MHLLLAVYSSVLRAVYLKDSDMMSGAVAIHSFSFLVPFFAIGRRSNLKVKENTHFINHVLEMCTVAAYQGYIFYL